MEKQIQKIIVQAGALIMEKRRLGFTVQEKGRADLVTEVDRETEAFLTRELLRAFPGHSVFGEEGGLKGPAQAEYLWLIDPIDGTTNFAHGFPYFCISLALTKNEKTLLAAVYSPYFQTLYSAKLGGGAFWNGEPLSVSKTDRAAQGLFAMGFPGDITQSDYPHLQLQARALQKGHGVLTLGSAALDLCQVAHGRLDAFWEKGIHSYDIAAGALLVQEAGGQVSKISGEPFQLDGGEILATNGRIHQELVQLLACKD